MSAVGLDISDMLKSFQARGDRVAARMIRGDDGRALLQMRVNMGVLQMEMDDRPDGHRPHGFPSLLEYCHGLAGRGQARSMPVADWREIDRELMQYYHRRICLLTVGSAAQSQGRIETALDCFRRAVDDADHNLGLMDFIRDQCPDEQYVLFHESYRPFVLFHRTLARVQGLILRHRYEDAIEATKEGIERILSAASDVRAQLEADVEEEESIEAAGGLDDEAPGIDDDEDDAEEVLPDFGYGALPEEESAANESESDSPVQRWVGELEALIEQIRAQHGIARTLREQIDEAIQREDFERAAELHRELLRRRQKERDEGERDGPRPAADRSRGNRPEQP